MNVTQARELHAEIREHKRKAQVERRLAQAKMARLQVFCEMFKIPLEIIIIESDKVGDDKATS